MTGQYWQIMLVNIVDQALITFFFLFLIYNYSYYTKYLKFRFNVCDSIHLWTMYFINQ